MDALHAALKVTLFFCDRRGEQKVSDRVPSCGPRLSWKPMLEERPRRWLRIGKCDEAVS
jgi:hypothetical protein